MIWETFVDNCSQSLCQRCLGVHAVDVNAEQTELLFTLEDQQLDHKVNHTGCGPHQCLSWLGLLNKVLVK